MVIQPPRDIEERLNELADREGKPVDQLVADAIEAIHPVHSRPQPWPKSIAIISDGSVDSSSLDEWLAEHWIDHLEQEMGGSSDGDDDDRSSG